MKKEEWMENKPFLAPKWLTKLIWFWILKEGKEDNIYAIGYRTIIIGLGLAIIISIPLILILNSYE